MTKPFDMALFLSSVLNGSKATQQRHLRQARVMQAAIQEQWKLDNPWRWKLKHINWFVAERLKNHSTSTKYYYLLTARMIWKKTKNGN